MESPEAGMNPDRCGFRWFASWERKGAGLVVGWGGGVTFLLWLNLACFVSSWFLTKHGVTHTLTWTWCSTAAVSAAGELVNALLFRADFTSKCLQNHCACVCEWMCSLLRNVWWSRVARFSPKFVVFVSFEWNCLFSCVKHCGGWLSPSLCYL